MYACNFHCSNEMLPLHGIVCGIIAKAHLNSSAWDAGSSLLNLLLSLSRPLSCLSSCKLSTLTARTEQHTPDQIINPNVPLHLHSVTERPLHLQQATWRKASHWAAHVSSSFSISFPPSWINSCYTNHRAGTCTTCLAYMGWHWVVFRLGSPELFGSIPAMTGRTSCPSPIRFAASLFLFCHHLRMFIRRPYF